MAYPYKKMTEEDFEYIRSVTSFDRVWTGKNIATEYYRDEMPEYGVFPPELYVEVLNKEEISAIMAYAYKENIPVVCRGAFLCNFLAMELSIIGLLAVAFAADLATASVPMLTLVQQGVGTGVLTPLISILIILGAISTAVNMISGIVTRCVNAVEKNMTSEKKLQGHLARNAVFTLIFTFLAFSIAQFGLMTVVKKGYAYLGYAALITLFIPFLIHAIATKGKEI